MVGAEIVDAVLAIVDMSVDHDRSWLDGAAAFVEFAALLREGTDDARATGFVEFEAQPTVARQATGPIEIAERADP